jgi:Fe-S cluster assembly protein SufD
MSLISNWEPLQGLLGTYGPAELQDLRKQALARFQAVGIPTHKDEEFKYTSMRELGEIEFQPAYGSNLYRDDLKNTAVGQIEAITLAFVNGQEAPELEVQGNFPPGMVLTTLREALETMPDKVLNRLGSIHNLDDKLGSTNDERFRWLNTAYLSEGAFLYVPKGVQFEHPIHILFANRADHGPFASHPRVLIVLEEGASAKVLESHVGLSGRYFSNAVTEIYLGRSANLEHNRFQAESDEAIHVGLVAAHQEADSVWTSLNAQFGAKTGRVDVNLWIDGEHTESWLNGAYVGTREQVLDNHTRIDHAKPNCNSFEVYKGILSDKAEGVFNGKIFVYEDAQKTDAKQTNQAILLSPTAQVNTKPQLEIFADDVKCTHGATVGQLREDALFYLRARGIPARQAQALLVYAFAAEVLEKISVNSVREALEKALYDKLQEDAEFHASGA